ncbi:MAG: DoxX-like family protein [Chitinophagaceae bacterium]|jgi:hypothetical protein
MKSKIPHIILTYCIAAIWLLNGLFCKVLDQVPRHQQIVARIMGVEHPRLFTFLIGCSEILMAVWIISFYKSRLNAIVQIAVIGIMNMLEFIMVPDLLLWGKFNALFAFLLMLLVYFNEFYLNANNKKRCASSGSA